MKILHTSDWHLGASDGNRSLKADQLFFLEEIYKVIEQENIDVVVIAGDVYDRAITSAEAIALYDNAMTHICNDLGKEVIIVAGNHDSAERLASCSNLLEKAGLHIVGALKEEPAIVSYEDTDFYLLPWISEDKVKSVYPEKIDEITGLSAAYKVVCDKCRETFVPGKKHIAVSHAFITGSELSKSDRAAELAVVGFAAQVSKEVFDGFDYVALGHIHKPQNVTENIRYSGTPMPYSFGKEETQEKSVTVIDTATMEQKIIPLKLLHKRTTIEDIWENVTSIDYPEDVKSGYVRIRITDEFVGVEKSSTINTLFENVLELSGASLSDENAVITMSMEEFREIENDPIQIFKSFYQECFNAEADQHYVDLFLESIEEVNNSLNGAGEATGGLM